MKSRRHFLQKGTFATFALLATKPFEGVSNTIKKITGFSLTNSKVVILHTGNQLKYMHHSAEKISALQKSTPNILLVDAGKPAASINYDISMTNDFNKELDNRIFTTIKKGNIKLGIIKVQAGQKNTPNTVNKIAAYLKDKEKCQMVVCLSQLGFKNKVVIDDVKLAQQSTHVDMIISSNAANYSAYPYIAQNGKKQEVIIQSANNDAFGLSNIEIEFDELQLKKSIGINNLLTRINQKN